MRVLFTTRHLQDAETRLIGELQSRGIELMVVVDSISAGLSEMLQNPPDVLLTGFIFSGKDSRLLIAHATSHGIPVVLYTALSEDFFDSEWEEGVIIVDKLSTPVANVAETVIEASRVIL